MKRSFGFFFLMTILLSGCQSSSSRLSRVFFVDTQGFSQTVTTPASLEKFDKINFLAPQPYQKVMRTWKIRGKEGDVSVLTSYYPSSQIMQYLEGQGGRAFGQYKEWHENGQLKISVSITGGKFDLGEAAESTWIFDGLSEAFDESGQKQAEIPYVKGMKQGEARIYYPGGKLWQRMHYEKDALHGLYEAWYESGQTSRKSIYFEDLLEGQSLSWWSDGQKQSQELYVKDALEEASYWNINGQLVAQVKNLNGQRAFFDETSLVELQTIQSGFIQGWVGYFNKKGELWHEITIKEGLKNGPETFFYPTKEGKAQPKIIMQWSQGVLQGTVRTWFDNGQLESERQIVNEESNGPYVAYYPDGSLRILEEYHKGKLVDGKYFALGSSQSVSVVQKGQGTATLFDEKGRMIKEVSYRDGEPCLYPSGYE